MTVEKLMDLARGHVSDDARYAQMNIVFFAHPDFGGHVSMPRFHAMLSEGMRKRGHRVQTFAPRPLFHSLPAPAGLKKWLGYIDQYLVFPREVRRQMKWLPDNTLFVFLDNALGPWVPLAAHRPHVIHCHDFMAQQAAIGELEEHRLKWTGRFYQRMIRNGYSMGLNFISGSENTRQMLLRFLPGPPNISELVYNGLHKCFEHHSLHTARAAVSAKFGMNLMNGYLLHVGGNLWYKNRVGVIEIYNAWRSTSPSNLPLLLIGHLPSDEVRAAHQASPFSQDIHFISNAGDDVVNLAYSGATVFLFPSIAEGFGWPIAEAMAAGCPVITTDERPMTEVAGSAGFLIPRRPAGKDTRAWAVNAGLLVERIVNFTGLEREAVVYAGVNNAGRFDTDKALDRIESIYMEILSGHPISKDTLYQQHNKSSQKIA